MKQLTVITALMIGGLLAWLLASRLSADALGMGVGLMFGVLAGVPTALLVLASGRRRQAYDDDEEETPDPYANAYGPRRLYPPVVIVLAQQTPQAPAGYREPVEHTAIIPAPAGQGSESYTWVPKGDGTYTKRTFRIVGEQEEYLDE